MKVWWEHRFWAPGQPYAVYVNAKWVADWASEAEAEAHVGRLQRAWDREKEALRSSWNQMMGPVRT